MASSTITDAEFDNMEDNLRMSLVLLWITETWIMVDPSGWHTLCSHVT